MRIPMKTGAGARTTALPTPYANTDTRGGFGAAYVGAADAVQNATENVSVAVKRADWEAERQAKEAKTKADAISMAQADTAFQRVETAKLVGANNRRDLIDGAFEGTGPATLTPADATSAPGFLSTRGKEAYEKAAPTLDEVDKARQKIARELLKDPETRARWMVRSDAMLADTERKVEQHSAQQFAVAQRDALEGVRASALEGVANATDAQSAANFTLNAEARIRELAVSKEGAVADIAKFRQDALTVRINRLLSDGDVETAEGQYKAAEGHLGTQAPKLRHAIDTAKRAQAIQSFDVEAQKQVDGLIEAGTLPSGQPDLEVVDAKLSLIPPGKLKDEVEQRLGAAKEKAARRWKQRVDRFADDASSTYEKTGSLGAVDPKVKSWLIDNAPDEWRKLRLDDAARTSHQRAVRTGDAAARREQAEIDKLALMEFRELPPAERATANVSEFLRGRGVSQIGGSAVKGEQTRATETVRAGDAMGESEFVRSVEAATAGLVGSDKGKAKEVKAQAVQAYTDLRTKAKGKPSSDEVRAEVDRLAASEATKPRIGESIRGRGVETVIERQIREQKESRGKETPPLLGPPVSARPAAPSQMVDKNGVLRERGADGKWRPVKK